MLSLVLNGMNIKVYSRAILLLILASFFGCSKVVESRFILSENSMPPKWFSSNVMLDDKNVEVVLSYYTSDRVKLELVDISSTDRGVIEEFFGTTEPIISESERYYPHYQKVSANGVTQVVLHKQLEPIFYIVE